MVDGVTVQQGKTVNTKTGFKNILGYNLKGGANYNINRNNNVFANVGYYSKQPFMNAVYPSNRQVLNATLTNEKIFSAELGYGFRSSHFNANVNVYRTEWKDRWLRRNQDFTLLDGSTVRGYAEINGITQLHTGVEVDATYKLGKYLELQGMFSLGDFRYKGNPTGTAFDENNNAIEVAGGSNSSTLYLDNVKVAGSESNSIPQLTASLGMTIKPVEDLRVYGTWRYVGKLYSSIDIATFTNQSSQNKGVLQLPDYNLLDVGISYKLKLKNSKEYFTIGANVNNLLDTTYIADGATSIFEGDKNATGKKYKGIDTGNRVYFGFGRTWSTSLSFHF